MLVETRKTAAGTEYWDTKAQKTVFVKRGVKPSFEVTKNPKSMLTPEDPQLSVGGIDLATGKDTTIINGQPVDEKTDIDLDVMDAKQLLAFAKQNDIDVPGNMKKAETIRNHIEESLSTVEE
ncbi:hypothetical protein [Jeotgalibacillus terrae]|uniref:Rho termination factor N-terminal domain-containing protein n=1 Tax=Jeotgalibacillus terrae TaxID=587735 RepID=A0ABW5ZG79_9BACL|nr:hypothetical protein [Jeotgalibacillus terrae]MBM7577679.1 hypothetical protein [Jeotgalibacillus terrae]